MVQHQEVLKKRKEEEEALEKFYEEQEQLRIKTYLERVEKENDVLKKKEKECCEENLKLIELRKKMKEEEERK